MKNKSILIVTECFAGGVYNYLISFNKYLSEHGMDVTILAGTKKETPLKEVLKNDFLDAEIITVNMEKRNLKSLRKFRYELLSLSKKINFDIIHLHSSFAGFIGRTLKEIKYSKKFYTPHGYSFLQLNKPLKSSIFKQLEKSINIFDKNTTTIA